MPRSALALAPLVRHVAPEAYAGEAIVALYHGRDPATPLTPAQERELVRNGFLARRHGARGPYLVLTRKGEDLAEDIEAEREWIEARGGAA